MAVRGIRGATVVNADTPDALLAETRNLLERIVEVNGIAIEDVASIIFTTTPDLQSEFPARAARLLGWSSTPLLSAVEVNAPHGVPRCIRVLLHLNTDKSQAEMKHVYLGAAKHLRPDLQ